MKKVIIITFLLIFSRENWSEQLNCTRWWQRWKFFKNQFS